MHKPPCLFYIQRCCPTSLKIQSKNTIPYDIYSSMSRKWYRKRWSHTLCGAMFAAARSANGFADTLIKLESWKGRVYRGFSSLEYPEGDSYSPFFPCVGRRYVKNRPQSLHDFIIYRVYLAGASGSSHFYATKLNFHLWYGDLSKEHPRGHIANEQLLCDGIRVLKFKGKSFSNRVDTNVSEDGAW